MAPSGSSASRPLTAAAAAAAALTARMAARCRSGRGRWCAGRIVLSTSCSRCPSGADRNYFHMTESMHSSMNVRRLRPQ
eukprot:1709831-Prymnesium_polylepis.1